MAPIPRDDSRKLHKFYINLISLYLIFDVITLGKLLKGFQGFICFFLVIFIAKNVCVVFIWNSSVLVSAILSSKI